MGRFILNIKNNLLPSTLRNRNSVMLGTTRGIGSANRIYNFNRNHSSMGEIKCYLNENNWFQPDTDTTSSFNSLNWERLSMSYNGQIQTALCYDGNI
jgi:hypothetical protein